MTTNKIQVRNLINEGLSIIKQMNIRSDSLADPNTRKLKETIKRLSPLIVNGYPLLSDILSNAERRLIENGIINAFFFGDTRTSLNTLKEFFANLLEFSLAIKVKTSLLLKPL